MRWFFNDKKNKLKVVSYNFLIKFGFCLDSFYLPNEHRFVFESSKMVEVWIFITG